MDEYQVVINGIGTLVNCMGTRVKRYISQICGTIKWNLKNPSSKVRQNAADLITRVAERAFGLVILVGIAIAGMTLTMARDLGSYGIRVMTIAPSLFATGLTAGIPDEAEVALTKDAAFPKRMGRPHEYAIMARAIVENPMMNGTTIRVDGGQRFAPR